MTSAEKAAAQIALRCTGAQERFLRVVSAPCERRANWLDVDKRVIGQVQAPLEWKPEARYVRVHLMPAGASTPKGFKLSATVSVWEVRELEECFDEPFISLSEHGKEVVKCLLGPMVPLSFRIAAEMDRQLKAKAASLDCTVTDLVRRAALVVLSDAEA